jgi:predicted metal-dependent peptidase
MMSRKTNWTRPNRRLVGLKQYRKSISVFPGKKRDPTYKICAITDTSGSMDTDSLRECLGVIYNMVQNNEDYEFWVVQADYEVQCHTKIADLSDIKKIAYDGIKGRGGTSFAIPITWALKNLKPDIIVYCTDGECHEEMDPPLIPVIWFCTRGGQKPNYGFGKVLQIQTTGKNRNG